MSGYKNNSYGVTNYQQRDKHHTQNKNQRDNFNDSDQMLHIKGQLQSGCNQKPANQTKKQRQSYKNNVNINNQKQASMFRNPHTQKNTTNPKYRKSMVFSIQLNQDQEVADQIRTKPFVIPVIRVQLISDTSNGLGNSMVSSRVSTNT